MFPVKPDALQQQMRNGRDRIVDVPLNVPILFGCEQISVDVSRQAELINLNSYNHLRRSLDVDRCPQKVEVERVKGLAFNP